MQKRASAFLAVLDQPKTRRLYRAAGVYLILGWGLIEFADVVFPRLDLPEWTVDLVIALAFTGLPVVLVAAWALDMGGTAVDEADTAVGAGTRALTGRAAAANATTFPDSRSQRASQEQGTAVRSLAVLPLENLAAEPTREEYFADGMTEALITELGRIKRLKVISRTSAMRYKGVRRPLPEIAEELSVEGIIEGSVLRAGDRVRISVQLLHGPTDRHLWAESYERELQDILGLQREIACEIAAIVQALTADERVEVQDGRVIRPDSHDAYLRGRFLLAKFTTADVRRALDHFGEAIAVDPNHAGAHAAIASAWVLLGQPLAAASNTEAMPRAREAAHRALMLDPDIAEAHAALGLVEFLYAWDWAAAEEEFRRALTLNPGSVDARWTLGLFLAAMGRREESITQVRRAIELDPFNLLMRYVLVEVLYYARRYGDAAREARAMLELEPGFGRCRWLLRLVYEAEGDYERAVALHRDPLSRGGADPASEPSFHELDAAYRSGGPEGYLRCRLEKELARVEDADPIAMLMAACLHAALGEKDRAMALLDRQLRLRSGNIGFLKVLPGLDPLRGEPAFTALLRQVNLSS